jgi:hypothetical protein
MTYDSQPVVGVSESDEFESDLDLPWAENIVTAAGTALTVLIVSSVAVMMYLA